MKTKAFEELKMRKALSYSYIIDDQETFYRDVSEEPGYPPKTCGSQKEQNVLNQEKRMRSCSSDTFPPLN